MNGVIMILAATFLIIPGYDLWERYRRSPDYRKLKRECGPDDWITKKTLRDLEKFYEPQWWHFICMGYGSLLIALKLLGI
jgi:hypothetical protein